MFYGIGWWFIIIVEKCISLIFKGQAGQGECWGRGMCVHRGQYAWQLDCWEGNREVVRLLEPGKGLLL